MYYLLFIKTQQLIDVVVKYFPSMSNRSRDILRAGITLTAYGVPRRLLSFAGVFWNCAILFRFEFENIGKSTWNKEWSFWNANMAAQRNSIRALHLSGLNEMQHSSFP